MSRTPSKAAHDKVLKAAVDLIAARGVEGTSMDAIAARSGVSKATIYKHWSGKEELLLDLFRVFAGQPPEDNTGDVRADLTALVRYFSQAQRSAEMSRIWTRIMAHAMSNPEFGAAIQKQAFGPRIAAVAKLIAQGTAKGELRKNIDVEFAADLLIGPVMHRRFRDDRNIPDDFPERVVEAFFNLWGI